MLKIVRTRWLALVLEASKSLAQPTPFLYIASPFLAGFVTLPLQSAQLSKAPVYSDCGRLAVFLYLL